MAATPQPSTVTYQDLADLEADFTDFDVELLRYQALHQRSLYDRRARLVRRIPNFWPLVLEQAPPEIDQYIQPSDAAVLLSALEDVEVSRFEIEEEPAVASSSGTGDPRSIAFRFTFAPNDVFEDRVLEKRFWYRWAPRLSKVKEGAEKKDGNDGEDRGGSCWSGLVSEPVRIHWKRGRDPTAGLLDLAVQVWEKGEEKEAENKDGAEGAADPRAALRDALDKTAVGGISFFAWFGYVGRRVSAEASWAAEAEDRARRAARAERAAARLEADDADANGGTNDDGDADDGNDDDDDDDDNDDNAYPYEIFPDGEELAVMLAEDLWPNAIRYFKEAQEQDDEASDDDFESEFEDAEPARPPSKKQRT